MLVKSTNASNEQVMSIICQQLYFVNSDPQSTLNATDSNILR
jgi:hypothetical protein